MNGPIRYAAYAVGVFMLLPIALWVGFGLFGPGSGAASFAEYEALAMVAASLPLPLAFCIVNLRTISQSMGGAANLSRADRFAGRVLTRLPALALLSSSASAAALWATGGSTTVAFAILLVGGALFAGMRLGFRRRAAAPARAQGGNGRQRFWNDENHLLMALLNALGTLVLVAIHVSAGLAFLGVLAAAPVVFGSILWIAHDSARLDAGTP
jgi:hypothetical protein